MRRFLDSQKLKQPLCTEETGEGTTNDHQQLVTLFQKVIRSRVAGLKLFHCTICATAVLIQGTENTTSACWNTI